MPRTRSQHFDLRGGINTSFSRDILDSRELRSASNARSGEFGSVAKRAGTQRVHVTAIGSGAKVLGLHQWLPAAGRQLVGISGANLYHKLQGDTNFTAVSGSFSTTARPSFVTHLIAGDPTLYIADGTLRTWDGTTIAAVTGAPAATRIAVYKTRMFAADGTKTLYWSRVSNPGEWSSLNGGGSDPIGLSDTEGITALEVVGSSLLIFKPNAIARFTGVSADNIRVDEETEGISADIGTIAPKTVIRVEDRVFFLSDRGAYMASESEVKPIGVKIKSVFDAADMDNIYQAVAVYHRARREVWVFFAENGETTNTAGYCYNLDLAAWHGPWDMSNIFDVCSAAHYELTDGSESVVLGGYDGIVRRGDVVAVGAKDDVLAAGTGGTNISMSLVFPPLFFGDATSVKRLSPSQHIRADLKTAGSLSAVFSSDLHTTTQTATIATSGTGVKSYRTRPGTYGRELGLTLTEATSEIAQLNSVVLEAEVSQRVA